MKLVAFLTLLLITVTVQAQVSFIEYYTKEDKKTTDTTAAYYMRLMVIENGKTVLVKDTYLSNNETKLFGMYKSLADRIFIGQKVEAYENGRLKAKEYYNENGKLVDTAQYYYPNGKLKLAVQYLHMVKDKKPIVTDTLMLLYRDTLGKVRLLNGNGYAEIEVLDKGTNHRMIEKGNFENHKRIGEWTGSFLGGKYTFTEYYDNGKLLHGTTRAANGEETKYNQSTYMRAATYPGGIHAFGTIVGQSYKYPLGAALNIRTGIVRVKFTVDTLGKVTDVKVLEDPGYGTGEEAIRAVSNAGLKKWIPGMIRGIPVNMYYRLPFKLKLEGLDDY